MKNVNTMENSIDIEVLHTVTVRKSERLKKRIFKFKDNKERKSNDEQHSERTSSASRSDINEMMNTTEIKAGWIYDSQLSFESDSISTDSNAWISNDRDSDSDSSQIVEKDAFDYYPSDPKHFS